MTKLLSVENPDRLPPEVVKAAMKAAALNQIDNLVSRVHEVREAHYNRLIATETYEVSSGFLERQLRLALHIAAWVKADEPPEVDGLLIRDRQTLLS